MFNLFLTRAFIIGIKYGLFSDEIFLILRKLKLDPLLLDEKLLLRMLMSTKNVE